MSDILVCHKIIIKIRSQFLGKIDYKSIYSVAVLDRYFVLRKILQ